VPVVPIPGLHPLAVAIRSKLLTEIARPKSMGPLSDSTDEARPENFSHIAVMERNDVRSPLLPH
jgi:hypothetical protein